jgi:hypothetical protein
VNGAIEADNLTLTGRGITVGTGTLPADQATPLINATNTDAASINLFSQTAGVTVNGVMNASSIRLTSSQSINTGNINTAAATPGDVLFFAFSSATPITTGSLDGTSIAMTSGCFFCSPANIVVNGAIGAGATKPTNISMFANSGSSVVIAGSITMDPAAPGSLFIGAGTTLTGVALAPLGVVTAGDGSSITLNAATPRSRRRSCSLASMPARPGRCRSLRGGNRAGDERSGRWNPRGHGEPERQQHRFCDRRHAEYADVCAKPPTDDLLGGSINVDRTGASGAPLLKNLNVTPPAMRLR